MLLPERRIDPVVGIERRDDDKADAAVAFGVTTFAREFDTNLPKLCRKGYIQDRFGMCVLHVGIAFSVSGLEANAVAPRLFLFCCDCSARASSRTSSCLP